METVNKWSQNMKILHYLDEHGKITDNDALKLKIHRLAARIYDLRKAGHKIETEMVYYIDQEDRTLKHYARYKKVSA